MSMIKLSKLEEDINILTGKLTIPYMMEKAIGKDILVLLQLNKQKDKALIYPTADTSKSLKIMNYGKTSAGRKKEMDRTTITNDYKQEENTTILTEILITLYMMIMGYG
ncbi:hypothetical protein [Vagococcus carniphilus]|uniref:hypothetical protein n=1 Tax=Vagococcus carniphilus TaxID=218144 RepID=UPI00288DE1AE|nr:hypothetical protein [Vagococcus carniphilus]MDT2865662.1 hypothetical protein [Vagococcus carniphilus]